MTTTNQYKRQYDAQVNYLDGLAIGLSPHSPLLGVIQMARRELVIEGPGNNGMLSCFLREAHDRIERIHQDICSTPHTYEAQIAYLDGQIVGLPSRSVICAVVELTRTELLREGPGQNSILSMFLHEARERVKLLEQEVCSITFEQE